MQDKEIVRTATKVKGRRWAKAVVRIRRKGGKIGLSITGEEGPYAFGRHIVHSAGQIPDTLSKWFPSIRPLLRYHLNDMKAECVHQAKLGWDWTTHPMEPCPTCGYKLGSEWKYHPLPASILKKALKFGAKPGDKIRGGKKRSGSGAWNVYLHGKLIDTVFYSPSANVDADEVRRSLINHDGYDPGITVRQRHKAPTGGKRRRPGLGVKVDAHKRKRAKVVAHKRHWPDVLPDKPRKKRRGGKQRAASGARLIAAAKAYRDALRG